MVSVAELIWPVRKPLHDGIDDVAANIAAGNPPPATEIVAVLDRCRCSESDLQAAVDRHVRVNELRRQVAAAATARKRFAAIEAEIEAAAAAVRKAVAAREALVKKVGEEYADLSFQVRAAEQAEAALTDRTNLPAADAARLIAVETAAADASERETAARGDLGAARRSLESAEANLPKAQRDARANPGNQDIQGPAEAVRNAIKARGERVKAAEVALREAEAAAAEARRRQADTIAAIRKAALS